MAPPTTYSLAELARLTDVTPRTVRYYIGQGLLPSPGSGPNARYGETHLARLRLIRRLQREHLPLAEIRRRIEDMPDAAVIALAEEGDPVRPPAPADSAVDYIRRLSSASLASRPMAVPAAAAAPAPASATSAPPSAAHPAAAPQPAGALAEAAPPMPSPMPSPPEPDRSTWERHTVAPDVEIHVRRPLDRYTSKQVERLIRIARDLLGDER